MVVTDETKRADLATLYKRAYFEVYSPQRQAEVSQSDPRLIASATYLAEHMHDVPVLIIPCVEAPPEQGTGPGAYASILPATWSLMLALRARGVGAAWTTLHLRYEQEAAALLGMPDGIRQAALLPVAYYTERTSHPPNVCLHGSGHIGMGGGRRDRRAMEVHHGDQYSALRVKLSDLIERMDLQSDEQSSFLNLTTGEVISITDEELRAAEENAPLEDFPEWQHDAIRIAGEIIDTDHYLPLPDRFEINEYRMMERFCLSVDDDDLGMICLTLSVVEERSGGSKIGFRRMGWLKTWYRYRDAALREIAVAWCEEHGIPYTET